jgi:hypothetical protein
MFFIVTLRSKISAQRNFFDSDLDDISISGGCYHNTFNSSPNSTILKIGCSKSHPNRKHASIRFYKSLLEQMRYDDGEHMFSSAENIPLLLGNHQVRMEPDLCIRGLLNGQICFVMLANDKTETSKDKEFAFAAAAVAIFQHNNDVRWNMDLQPLHEYTVPGVILRGSYPTFYKVTDQLEHDSSLGGTVRPDAVYVLHRYHPLPINERTFDCMLNQEQRIPLLKSFAAFRKFVEQAELLAKL